MAIAHPCEQPVDRKVFRADVIERGEPPAERVVTALEDARAFEREDVGRLFDDAERRVGAGLVAADLAGVLRGEKAAVTAGAHLGGVFEHGLGHLPATAAFPAVGAHQPESDALGAAGSDAGQTLELDDEALERFRVVDSAHSSEGENATETTAFPPRVASKILLAYKGLTMETPPADTDPPPPPTRPLRPSRRLGARVAQWAGELVTVFVGVYAAFALNTYQSHRQERQRREQILDWAQAEYSETLANVTSQENDLRKSAAEFHRRIAAGETPALHAFNFVTDYNPADFTSMLQSGGFELLQVETVRAIRDVESSLRQMVELARHDQQLSDELVLPNLDKPPDFFYDRANRRLRPSFDWINSFFETQVKIDEQMRVDVGKTLTQLRCERERNR